MQETRTTNAKHAHPLNSVTTTQRPEPCQYPKMVDLLKMHIFLFYASVSCFVVFIVVYYKTYTDASYNDIGSLMMLCALGGAIAKPTVCSIADRHNTYKQWLMLALSIMLLSDVPLFLLPFYPQLLFAEPHPRFVWYSLAALNLIGASSMGVAITLTDVFVVHKCTNSSTGQYFGQYRFYGVLGWGCCSLALAFIEQYVANLPALVLPMAVGPVVILLDLMVVYQLKNIERRRDSRMVVATVGEEYSNMGKQVQTISITPLAKLELNYLNQQPKPMQLSREKAPSRASLRGSQNLEDRMGSITSLNDGRRDEISLSEQLNLLVKLNRYDHYNLLKYLLLLVILGAFLQVHYAFYLQFMVEVLRQRNLSAIFFTFNAVSQLCNGAGESLGLLFISRLAQTLGRDVTLMLCFTISGLRYAVAGFLVDYLNVWMLALIEIQSGILFGLSYTLITETAASYLSILDKLLLIDADFTTEQEDKFIAHLEQLKDVYSIESIRFALKATIQSLFSGSCEGIGFALGPVMAGFWLNLRADSIKMLYQDLVGVHFVVLCSLALLEFGIIRLMLGVSSRTDKLRVRG